MKYEKINFSLIIRIAFSLIPIFFGMPTVAAVVCAYNLAMTLILIGPISCLICSLSAICLAMFFCSFMAPGGELQGLFLSLEAILSGVLCGIITFKRDNFYKGVWFTAIGYLIPSYINVMQASHKVGQSVSDFLTLSSMEQMKMQLSQMLSELQLNEEALLEVIDLLQKTTAMVIPSVLIVTSIIIGYIIMWCVNYTLRKLPIKNKTNHLFSTLRMPKVAVIIMLVVLCLFFVIDAEKVNYLLINVFVVFASLSFFSGMSVIDFFLRKKIEKIFPRLVVHIIIYMVFGIIAGMFPFANIIFVYIILSVVDSFVNIRRIRPDDQEGEEDEEE